MPKCKTTYLMCASVFIALSTMEFSLASELPNGKGREVVKSFCSSCHRADLISESSGYSQEGWKALIASMIDLSALPKQEEIITGYLAEHFPPHRDLAPSPVNGDVEIVIEDWVVPTLGQRPRDPAEAPDGSIWWAGQWGNLIGRIDPKTGKMTEYALPANSMPHTVTFDHDGKVWFTGNKNGTIGKFDPSTTDITVFKLPDPSAKDPHSAIFDKKGRLFFTVQQSNMIGRLDPVSGDIRLAKVKTPQALPYGIKIDAKGVPWVSCFGSNCLIKVDPETMELTEIELPNRQSRSRRLDIASDGAIWYVDSSLGRLGRYDPNGLKGEKFKDWPSPSGSSSHPYAIAIIDDVVWYNESGMKPDTLVRFDPKRETFQSWAIPSGDVFAGMVRHMRPTAKRDLLIHQTATNRIQKVSLSKSNLDSPTIK